MRKFVKVTAVIPARILSTRLPRKVLVDVCGKPLIQHVWERVVRVKNIDEVMVVTDSPEVLQVVASWGGKGLLSDPACQSGTERIASILYNIKADLILNVQGDEPLVDPAMLDELVASWISAPSDLITPVYRINNLEDLANPNVVKVVRAWDGRALYFSRSSIPNVRDWPMEKWLEYHAFWGHIGVYGYRPSVLVQYPELPSSTLQQAESLEQLRFLEAGYIIQTMETTYRSIAVDTPEDLDKVRHILCN
jgi:3-deoxy-manno-octulosonate cytidylyltransferase (CMP-KDO synthetase)